MHKAFEYRLYPNYGQHRLLLSCLAESRRLYNEMLESVKAHYEETGKFLTRHDLTYRFKGRGGSPGSEHVPQTTVQTLADRLDKALKRFFHRKEDGQKVGFPRLKCPNRWHSIHLRQYGSGRDAYLDPDTGRLRVPKKLGVASRSSNIARSKGRPRPPTSSTGPMGTGTFSSSAPSGRRQSRRMDPPWASTLGSRSSQPTPRERWSRTRGVSGVRRKDSGGRSARFLAARRAPGGTRRRPGRSLRSTSRSPASARTMPTRRPASTSTSTPFSPWRTCGCAT